MQQHSVQYVATEMTRLVLAFVGLLQIDKTLVSSLFYGESHFPLYIILLWQQPFLVSHYIKQSDVNYKQLLSI